MYEVLNKAQLTGHDVFELAVGTFPMPWGADSLYLTDETMAWLQKYLRAALPKLNWYGPNLLRAEDWNAVQRAFEQQNGRVDPEEQRVMEQLNTFVRRALLAQGAVTLYGV